MTKAVLGSYGESSVKGKPAKWGRVGSNSGIKGKMAISAYHRVPGWNPEDRMGLVFHVSSSLNKGKRSLRGQ